MCKITLGILKALCPLTPNATLNAYVSPLNAILPLYHIHTPARVRMFLAQVAHESGYFQFTKELASGKAYDTGALAKRLGNTPEADGDGQRYKGRGLIQITGRSNYERIGRLLGLDLLTHPELLEQPINAVKSACEFWKVNNLNTYADRGDLRGCTKVINGGFNGWDDRTALYTTSKRVIV